MRCPVCDQETSRKSELLLRKEIRELEVQLQVERSRADSYRAALRDQFAVAALSGLIANSAPGQIVKSDGSVCITMQEVQERFAELAYGYANAMLKRREVLE